MTDAARVAERFGNLLVQGDYAAALALLSSQARAVHTPENLRRAVEEMTAYAPGPIRRALLVPEGTLEDWPGRRDGELARLYVALEGDAFNEAVSVLLVREGDAIRIRELEWGRP